MFFLPYQFEKDMDKTILISLQIEELQAIIVDCVNSCLKHQPKQAELPLEDPLNDLIPKSEVRGKLASASSLWKWERAGKIQSYGLGGKRFYKRSELMAALTKIKH